MRRTVLGTGKFIRQNNSSNGPESRGVQKQTDVASIQRAPNAATEDLNAVDEYAEEPSEEEVEGEGEGEPYYVTPTPDQAAKEESYKPATSLDDLEPIGGPSGWWEEAWDKEHQFKGYVLRLISPLHPCFGNRIG